MECIILSVNDTDPVKWNNIPLTATEWLRMTRPEHPKYDRNKNILIVGGSGAGKTRGFVKPSLMQMQCSYVVTDPKGTVLEEVDTMLGRGARATKYRRSARTDRP